MRLPSLSAAPRAWPEDGLDVHQPETGPVPRLAHHRRERRHGAHVVLATEVPANGQLSRSPQHRELIPAHRTRRKLRDQLIPELALAQDRGHQPPRDDRSPAPPRPWTRTAHQRPALPSRIPTPMPSSPPRRASLAITPGGSNGPARGPRAG